MSAAFDDGTFPPEGACRRNISGSHPLKVLFVCSRNRIRSLSAERIMAGLAGFQARSAGTQPDARVVLTEGHLRWADIVLAMEKSHLARIHRKYPEGLRGREAHALHIPDVYTFMQPELLDELRARLGEFFRCQRISKNEGACLATSNLPAQRHPLTWMLGRRPTFGPVGGLPDPLLRHL